MVALGPLVQYDFAARRKRAIHTREQSTRSSIATALVLVSLAASGCCKKSSSDSGDTPAAPIATTVAGTATATAAPTVAPPVGAVTVGTSVMAPWSRRGTMYGGVVGEIYGKLGYVKFNDGDAGWALLEKMRPAGTSQPDPAGDTCAFQVGSKVKAPWSRTRAMYSGVISEVYGKLGRVDFLDGDQGWANCADMRAR